MRRRSQRSQGNLQLKSNEALSSCSRKPCLKTQVCNPVDKMCYARGSLVAKAVVNNQKKLNEPELRRKQKNKTSTTSTTSPLLTIRPLKTTHFPKVGEWKKRPGEAGFVEYLGKFLALATDAGEITTNVSCPKFDSSQLDLMLWQSMLKWYFRPQSPVQRILLGWELGTGKTVGILVTLDNYFDDQRPKILFFHTVQLVDNFYKELSSFPNKYRNWYTSKYPEKGPYPNDKDKDVNNAWLAEFKMTLQSYAAHRDGQSTPLKCFLYPEGGNASISSQSIMKQYGAEDRMLHSNEKINFSNMIIIGDEAHQLTNPSPDVFYDNQMNAVLRCADRIKRSRNSIVMMMTATPPIHNITRFMSVVTGKDLALEKGLKSESGSSVTDRLARGAENLKIMKESGVLEGHIAWYMYRDARVFAIATPNLATMPIVIPCVLNGTQLYNYLGRRFLRNDKGYVVPKKFLKKEATKCKEDQELIDEKCKKKCNPTQERNAKGRCVKSSTACKEDQELIDEKCKKKCNPTQERNTKGKCVKSSTAPTGGGFLNASNWPFGRPPSDPPISQFAGLVSDLQHLPTSTDSLNKRKADRRTSGRKLSCLDLSSYVGDNKKH